MAKYYDIDTPLRLNGDLTLTGTYSAIIGGTLSVTGVITGTTLSMTGTISGNSYAGSGTGLTGILLQDGSRNLTGNLNLDTNALIFQTSDATNIDHVWFDDTLNTYHFVADSTYKANGNAILVGSVFNATSSLQEGGVTLQNKYVQRTAQIIAGTGLTGGGDLTANRTLSVSYGSTAGTAAEGNHNHNSTYLGITATASDSSKLGGVVAGNFLRSDIAGTMSNNLTVNGLLSANALVSNTTIAYGSASSRGALSYGTATITLEATSTNTSIDIKSTGTGTVKVNGNLVYHAGNLDTTTYLKNNVTNQGVIGNFTVSGNGVLYVGAGTTGTTGTLVIKNAATNSVQIEGGTATKLTGVKAYINGGSGIAQFDGAVTVGSLITNSSGLVAGFNAELINSVKEADLAKNISIEENTGFGVYNGLIVSAQTVPNMTVLVGSGVVYTDTGRRVSITSQSQSIVGASATYDRIDVIYVKGSESGINEGEVGYMQGTPASTPLEPSIPATAVKLATVRVLKNIGSIQGTHITDARNWKPVSFSAYGDNKLYIKDAKIGSISGDGSNSVVFSSPIKGTPFVCDATIAAGNTSYTWVHNLGLGTNYVVLLSSNSPDRHVYWSSKVNNSVQINIDDVADTAVQVNAIIIAY